MGVQRGKRGGCLVPAAIVELLSQYSQPYRPSHSSSSSSSGEAFFLISSNCFFFRSRSRCARSDLSSGHVPFSSNHGRTHSRSKMWVGWHGSRTSSGWGSSTKAFPHIGQSAVFFTLLMLTLSNAAMYSSSTPSTSRGGLSAVCMRASIMESKSSPVPPSLSLRITPKASARVRNAAETSPGTGTACSRVRCDSGVISVKVEKNVDRSGRRGRDSEDVEGSSLACSPWPMSAEKRPAELPIGDVLS